MKIKKYILFMLALVGVHITNAMNIAKLRVVKGNFSHASSTGWRKYINTNPFIVGFGVYTETPTWKVVSRRRVYQKSVIKEKADSSYSKKNKKGIVRRVITSKPVKILAVTAVGVGVTWYALHRLANIPSPFDLYRKFAELKKNVREKIDKEHKKDKKQHEKAIGQLNILHTKVSQQQGDLEDQGHRLNNTHETVTNYSESAEQGSRDIVGHANHVVNAHKESLKGRINSASQNAQKLLQDSQNLNKTYVNQTTSGLDKIIHGLKSGGQGVENIKNKLDQLKNCHEKLFSDLQAIELTAEKEDVLSTETKSAIQFIRKTLKEIAQEQRKLQSIMIQALTKIEKDQEEARTNYHTSQSMLNDLNDSNSEDTRTQFVKMMQGSGSGSTSLDRALL